MSEEDYSWISLHRKFLKWEWYTDINTCHLFTYCLLRANYAPTKWRGIDIARGQFLTSLKTISNETGLSFMQVRTALTKLEKTSEITNKSSSKSRLITVVNYNKYQDNNKQSNKPDNNQITNEQQTDNKQVTTNNNINNLNNSNNSNNTPQTPQGDFNFLKWNEIRIKMNGSLAISNIETRYFHDNKVEGEKAFEKWKKELKKENKI